MYVYTAMAEIIKPQWSFVKIYPNIQWSLFTENSCYLLFVNIIPNYI